MKRIPRYLPLGLAASASLLLGTLNFGPAAEPKDKDPKPAVHSVKEADLASKNIELLSTAYKLKEYGMGVEKKGEFVGGDLESLILAARLMRQVPKPGKMEAEAQAGKEADAPASTDATLATAQQTDLTADSKEALDRARLLLEKTVTDPKKKAAYETLLAEVEKMEPTRAVAGGAKAVRRSIKPGQFHVYKWDWEEHLPGAIAYRSTGILKATAVAENGSDVYGAAISSVGVARFIPGGLGTPTGRTIRVVIRLTNVGPTDALYDLFAN